MFGRVVLIVCICLSTGSFAYSQCASSINSFPYREDFELSSGNWNAGGIGSDWTWGTPVKPTITTAGSGTRCWVTGGLSGSSYTDGEASWLQGPCFDFTNLQYPYIEFKVFWEMEQQFDGGGLQYSLDNGATWTNVGSANDGNNCLNGNWFNHGSINYLSSLASIRHGWSGNVQATAGSCRGGNGSNGWVVAKHTMPYLAGKSNILFRFIFGAGTICNNYDGFAIDDITIKEAPANQADFSYLCISDDTVSFSNTSALCPINFSWDFGDPASGTSNGSTLANPSHVFSGPGTYLISLTVSGPGNAPSTTTKELTVLGLTTTVIQQADCLTGTGGSASVAVSGGSSHTYSWNSEPVQTSLTAVGLKARVYTVTVMAAQSCPASANVTIPLDLSCIGVYFPSGFTPNTDGLNDLFGPLGSIAALSDYSLSIYNRWGERVFHTTDPFKKWNGHVKGQRTGSNVFTWYAEFSLQGQPKVLRKGTITLIR